MVLYQLCESVSFCWAGERAVFLDTRRDRYFRLAARPEAIFRELCEAGGQAVPDIALLIGQGLVEPTDTILRPPMPAEAQRPTTSLLDSNSVAAALDLPALVDVGWRLWRARLRLKRSALNTILAGLRKARSSPTGTTGPQPSVVVLTRRFNAARRRTPLAPSCLPDALALLDLLSHHRVFPHLVFGVRVDPFRAHCWVQAGETVLNDALDPILAHTPILVV